MVMDEKKKEGVINSLEMDLSSLVGREIIIFSEKYQGKPIKSKVVLVNEHILSIDHSGSVSLLDKLFDDQEIIVQFLYKGQRVSVPATLRRNSHGQCHIKLGKYMIPLLRRRFHRFNISQRVKCAVISAQTFNKNNISRLRWIETDSLNLSSGGIMLTFPSHLTNTTYLLLNIEAMDIEFPRLIVGKVCYSYPMDKYHFNIGVEFIVTEKKEIHFPQLTLKQLPPVVFQYSVSKRAELEKKLTARMQK